MSRSFNAALVLAAKERCRALRRRATPAEQQIWERVRDRKFMGLKFYRQYPFFFGVSDRDTFAIADFYCDEKKLVVEIDGKVHEDQRDKDAARTEIINCFGVDVIRFSNEEVEQDLDEVMGRLERLISRLPRVKNCGCESSYKP